MMRFAGASETPKCPRITSFPSRNVQSVETEPLGWRPRTNVHVVNRYCKTPSVQKLLKCSRTVWLGKLPSDSATHSDSRVTPTPGFLHSFVRVVEASRDGNFDMPFLWFDTWFQWLLVNLFLLSCSSFSPCSRLNTWLWLRRLIFPISASSQSSQEGGLKVAKWKIIFANVWKSMILISMIMLSHWLIRAMTRSHQLQEKGFIHFLLWSHATRVSAAERADRRWHREGETESPEWKERNEAQTEKYQECFNPER